MGINNTGRSLEKIEMQSIAQCEEESKKLAESSKVNSKVLGITLLVSQVNNEPISSISSKGFNCFSYYCEG